MVPIFPKVERDDDGNYASNAVSSKVFGKTKVSRKRVFLKTIFLQSGVVSLTHEFFPFPGTREFNFQSGFIVKFLSGDTVFLRNLMTCQKILNFSWGCRIFTVPDDPHFGLCTQDLRRLTIFFLSTEVKIVQ